MGSTLFEYLQKREKLQSPAEQERLLHEIPQAIADDLESESPTLDDPDKIIENDLQESWQTTNRQASLLTEVPKAVADGFVWKATKLDIADLLKQENNSPKSILGLSGAPEVPLFNMESNGTVLNCISPGTDSGLLQIFIFVHDSLFVDVGILLPVNALHGNTCSMFCLLGTCASFIHYALKALRISHEKNFYGKIWAFCSTQKCC